MFVPQGPARQPGRQAPPVEPDDDPEAAEARPRRRQLLVGDEPALVRQAHRRPPGDGHRRRRARAAVGDGAGQQGPHPVSSTRPASACRSRCPRRRTRPRRTSSGRSRSGRTRSSATARGSTSSPTPRAARSTSSTRRSRRSAPAGRRRSRTSTCPTRRSAAASTRRCAACSRTTWSSATARSPTTTRTRRRRGTARRRTPTARPARTRTRCNGMPIFEEADAGQLPRHRHHARGPLVRPVPAVRRAHVPRQRQDDQAGALADVRGARHDGERASRRCSTQVETLPDRAQREITTELVQALLDMYGEGLVADRRARLRRCRSRTSSSRTCCCCTGCIRCRCEERVRGALDEVRPYLVAHGGGVELLGVDDGVVHLRLEGACNGCPSSALTLQAGGRGGDHAGRARRRADRGRGRRRRRSGLLQIEIACPVPQAG